MNLRKYLKTYVRILALAMALTYPATGSWATTVTVGGLAAGAGVTPVSADTLRYVPKTGASMTFTLNVAGAGFGADTLVSLDWYSTPPLLSPIPMVSASADSTGDVSFASQDLTVTQSNSFVGQLDANGRETITVKAVLISQDATTTGDDSFNVIFTPAETTFTMPNTAISSNFSSVTVTATLAGTLSTDIMWIASADGAFTTVPTTATENVAYGFDGTKSATFNLTGVSEGDELIVTATLGKFVDSSGAVVSKDLKQTVTFLNAGALKIEPGTVNAYLSCPLNASLDVSPITALATNIISIDSITPTSWDNIVATWDADTIYLRGTPTAKDSRTFNVNAYYNGTLKTPAFTVIVSDPVLEATPSSFTAKVGEYFNETVEITHVPDSATLTNLAVSGISYGISSTLYDTTSPPTVRFFGTPSTAGTALFEVTGAINAIPVTTKNISVTILSADVVTPASLVSTQPGAWSGVLNPDNTFEMSTAITLPAGAVVTDIDSVVAVFPIGVVTTYAASVTAGSDGTIRLVITGTTDSTKTAGDLLLRALQLIMRSGTIYEQTDINVSMKDITGSGGGSGGGCNTGTGTVTLALLALTAALKRR